MQALQASECINIRTYAFDFRKAYTKRRWKHKYNKIKLCLALPSLFNYNTRKRNMKTNEKITSTFFWQLFSKKILEIF